MTKTEKKTKKIINKEEKERKLLEAAFSLFIQKGVYNTTVQEIVDKAGVAKGTFYLYFKDKYALQDYLITDISRQLFSSAIKYVDKKNIVNFYDRIIYIIDFIIDKFVENQELLEFISKNLSWGVFGDRVSSLVDDSSSEMLDLFRKGIKDNNINIENPELTLFMIIELTSSTVFSSITINKPLPINEFKPYLYKKIRNILSD
ncbi:MAG: TetR/AcrR family transcriptional regulator [Bacilli bacterium]|nr:TetR/AcrR family transcriptional regulator [Bacilli bacterium]